MGACNRGAREPCWDQLPWARLGVDKSPLHFRIVFFSFIFLFILNFSSKSYCFFNQTRMARGAQQSPEVMAEPPTEICLPPLPACSLAEADPGNIWSPPPVIPPFSRPLSAVPLCRGAET